jgi:molybdenum cofactor cytidylyltransferase
MTKGYGFVLLAAGNSSRMGEPKALLPYKNTTLIGHVIGEMQKLASWPIAVVTGAHSEFLEKPLAGAGATVVYNARWQEGMASSIRCGLAAFNLSLLEGVIFAVCDQPAVSAGHFYALSGKKESGEAQIVASAYADTVGIPVLFGRKYFTALQNLSGEEGAKSLLKKHAEDMAQVALLHGEFDIDTKQDYARLKKQAGCITGAKIRQ